MSSVPVGDFCLGSWFLPDLPSSPDRPAPDRPAAALPTARERRLHELFRVGPGPDPALDEGEKSSVVLDQGTLIGSAKGAHTMRTFAWILASGLLAAPMTSQPAHHPSSQEPPVATIDAFHHALEEGDLEAALALLVPEVTIFESGGAEMSRDEYASHHLSGDMKFSAAVETEIVDRQFESSGESAWVLTRSRTRGTYGDREIDARGTETMILRRTGSTWKIVHIHWSSRSR